MAPRPAILATILERAPARNIQRAWNVAGQNSDVLILSLVGRKNGFKQGLRVGVAGTVELVAVELLHHIAEVHDRDAVTEQAHQRHIVADKNVRYALFALELDEELNNRVLNGNVEGGGRLVAGNDFRLQCQSPRYRHALTLSAAHIVRVAAHEVGGQFHLLKEFPRLSVNVACGN